MRRSLLIATLAICTLACAAGTASAFPLTISPGGNITSTGIRFTLAGPLGVDIYCDVTLNGALARSVLSARSSLGIISNVDVRNCSYPVTPLDNNSWPISAQTLLSSGAGLNGLLARISGVGLLIEDIPLLGDCLATGVIDVLIRIDTTTGSTQGIGVLATTLASDCTLFEPTVVAAQSLTLSPANTIRR